MKSQYESMGGKRPPSMVFPLAIYMIVLAGVAIYIGVNAPRRLHTSAIDPMPSNSLPITGVMAVSVPLRQTPLPTVASN